jgi:hypothetical protein
MVFDFFDFGRDALASFKISPDAFVQTALQVSEQTPSPPLSSTSALHTGVSRP